MSIRRLPIDITVYDLQGISLNAEYKEPVVAKTPVTYKVNTSQAGQGELKVELIPPETSIIPCQCHVHKLNSEEYLIEYIPYESGQYKLRILFNNQLIQGKTFDTNVYSVLSIPLLSTNVHIEKILPNDIPKIGDEIYLQIMTDKSFIHGQVSFNGISIPCQLQQTDDNKQLWHLKFRPYTAGIYKIHLFHNGLSILHSPYLIEVKDIDRKNYLSGIVNRPFMIEIHTKSILNSQIRAVVLLGSNQIPSTMTIVDEHLIQINFIPYEPGFYFINIYNGNQSIEGSPFLIRIKRPQVVEISGMCLDHLRLNDLGIFRIHCHGQRETVNAKIFYLSNNDRCDNGQLISFQLLETYEQLIQFSSQIFINLLLTRLRLTKERIQNLTIQDNNGHATISFQLIEIPKQLPTNEQVINTLRNLIDKQILNLIDPNQYILHTICGSLVIGEPISVKLFSLPNGDYLGEFTPNKIGRYRIDTTFGGKHINDSPIYTEIYDPLQVRIGYLPKEFIVGIEYTFDIDINKAGNAPLEVFIISPSGIKVPCKIDETLSKIKKVHFTPIEIGYHDLNVKFGSDMISGTPIKMMVNNTRVITAYGDGLYQGLQNKITTFMIDTKEIEGDLNIRIEDSNSIIKNTLERINKNLFKITYTPNEVGYINISIKWNGKDIINSPFTVIINNPEHVQMVNDQQSIIDSQNHIRMKINEEKTLCFDTSHAGPGNLKATIQSIDNDSIPIHIDQQGNFYILNFTLIREGEYDLMITYGNNLLPNMPIRLIGYDQYSPLKVICSGDGLKMGIIGKEMKCLIDTRHVNPGDITVQCQGNHKKAFCRLVNNQDGTFYLFIKPEETGKHLLTIKYNGKDVPGSPYTVKVSGPSDARKVRVYGPGIQHGVLSSFQSHFICETKGAGAGQLSVEIRGPKDAFRVEMQRRNIQDRTIICRYYPSEPGDYLLSVKWSGEHVYGSPFHTHLFQSQQEFDQYQQFH